MKINVGLVWAVMLPFIACVLQLILWDTIKPYVWFLFFPTAFFSSWIGGLAGGLVSTIISALLVWYVFIPPRFSFVLDNPAALFSILIFILMGCLFAFFFDRLQKAMRKTDESLKVAEEANVTINQLYQKTLQLDILKSQFFANVSHELRTPLTLIIAPLEKNLHRPVGPDFPEAARHETEIMLRNARLLYRHVTDLLDAAKLDAGRMTLTWTHLDLAKLIRAMASNFELLATQRHIHYTVIAPQLFWVQADNEKLQRILLNLLSNAFKFTPDGGTVEVRLSEQEGQALIQVQDNGPGVPVEMRELVFERFSQVDGVAQRRHGGTGLGLSIAKNFVDLHKGQIKLEASPGGGALFSVKIPLVAPLNTVLETSVDIDKVIDRQIIEELESHNFSAKPMEEQESGGDKPLVLVVEDNDDMREFVAEILLPFYRVVCAQNGRDGMNKALELYPDLILSDVMMPEMSGDAMVVALRKQPGFEAVPIVMLTAKADDELRIRMLAQGVQEYINKPFVVDELLARIGGLMTTRRHTKNELTRSAERFRQIFEQAAVGIALISVEGHWLRVNQKLCDIVGYSQDELLSKTFQDITPPDELNADLAYVHLMLEGKIQNYSIEKRYIRKNGKLIWVNLTVALVRKPDATPDYFISIIEDINSRKQTESLLKESEQRYRSLFENTLEGVAHCQMIYEEGKLPDFVYLDVNAAFEALTGLVKVNFRKVSEVIPGIQYSNPELFEIYGRVASGSAPEKFETYVPELKIWFSISAYNAEDNCFIAVFENITERKLAEEEIHRFNAELERRVAERTAELSASNSELDSFAYAVSHDLRAPLRAMSGFSQALSEDYGSQLQGEGKVYLEQIELASRKMGDLIDGILALSRSTRGELHRDSIDLSALAINLLEELARSEPERKVEYHVAPNLKAIGDERMIEAVMRNLLGNAWKYTGKTAVPIIRVYYGELGGMSGFCVADNGAGFNMDHIERLFHPFQRLHRQDEFPGLGIGLATVQRIIHRHGGEIGAEGIPGNGATFCFNLST